MFIGKRRDYLVNLIDYSHFEFTKNKKPQREILLFSNVRRGVDTGDMSQSPTKGKEGK